MVHVGRLFSMPISNDFSWVTPQLLFWQAYDSKCRTEVSCCAHVVDGSLVLVDPIKLTDPAEKELLTLVRPLAVIITNGNHYRATAHFRTRYGIPVIAHPEAGADLGITLDQVVADGIELFDQFQVITLPGAGPGEIALYREEFGTLTLGDIVVHLTGHGFSVLPDKYCENPQLARQSLRKLKPLSLGILTFAHGLPMVSEAGTRLNRLIDTNL